MNPREHQQLIRDNIAAAIKAGDYERAALLRKVYADLLAIDLTEPEPKIPVSPINSLACCLDNLKGVE